MIQLRPTFSESWYRVAQLRARLRSSAQISRQFYRGERWYVVRDPAGNQFHRLSDAAYRFIGLLDGSRTVEQAWDICGGQLADDAPTQPEIIQILSHLYSANLIEADVTPDATVLLRRNKQLNKRKMQNRLMNVLFPRIPLWDPDSFLVRWLPVMRQVFSWLGAFIWIGTILVAGAFVLPQWRELKAQAGNAVDPSNWLWLWAVFVGIKLIHELGHAFACRRFGGECHELGIMFLVFIPTPYVDASAAWSFPSRWQRMFVGAAGMIVELFVASVLAIGWTFVRHDTLPAQLMYNAMLIASVSTLVFNANPLLRYDGYYILSDFLEIPNLRQKSTEYAMGLVKRHVFGVKATQPLPPPGQRFWLFSYAVASSIYRVFVGFVIILVVAYKIPILGMLMAIGGVATWLLVPVGKLLKYLMLEPELHRKRGRATAFCAVVAVAAIVCIGFVPFPVYVDATGIAEPFERQVVHTKGGGFVRLDGVVARDGQSVQAGQKILVLEDRRVEAEVASRAAELAGLEVQLAQAQAEDQSQRQLIAQQMITTQDELADARRRLSELTITAPIAGTLVAPHLSEMAGSYLPRGTEIATVATIDSLVVRAVTDQEDHQLVADEAVTLLATPASSGGPTQVCFAGDVQRPVPGKVWRIYAGANETLPHPSLSQNGGGQVAPDPSDPKGLTPKVRQFEVDVRVDNATAPDSIGAQPLYPGQTAYVRFKMERRPLLFTWTRRLYQLLQSHENDSKLT